MRFHIVTLGCPKNDVDSEMMGEILRSAGHRPLAGPARAEVIILNTCAFIHDARQESYRTLRRLARHKRGDQRLVAAGCLAQRYGEALFAQVPGLDGVIGTRSWPKIAHLVERLAESPEGTRLAIVEQEGSLVSSVQRRPPVGASAYLKIADGCDASCAFCAIPLIKGRQQSKPPADVIREAQELAAQGVREVILIAQDTTAYGRDLDLRDGLPSLIQELADALPEIEWWRILYAYPQHVSAHLIETMARLPQVCHYLDIPLQHADPQVLRRMGRPADVEAVRERIAALRSAMPDIALRTTFIVGFPGETEHEFETLLSFMEEMAFDRVGVFQYSREEGTPAEGMEGQLPAEVVAERYDRAMRLQQAISLERNRQQLGRVLRVLVEGTGEGLSVGRSYRDAPEIDGMVLLPGTLTPGEFVNARVVSAQEYDLVAKVLGEKDEEERVPGRLGFIPEHE